MIPLVSGGNHEVIHIFFTVPRFRHLHLQYNLPAETSILIGDRLLSHFEQPANGFLSIDSISHLATNDTIKISYYQPAAFLTGGEWQVVNKSVSAGSRNVFYQYLKRSVSAERSWWLIILLIIFIYLATAYNAYQSTFADYFNLRYLM